VGLIVAMFAIALVFVVIVFYAAQSSGSRLHEPEQEADETEPEEKESNKMAE
jgi:acid phosphatase family membrane protein YuiD